MANSPHVNRLSHWRGLFTALWLGLLAPASFASATAETQYQSSADFVSQAFAGLTPQAKVLWLTAEQKTTAEQILNRPFNRLRVRYWQLADQTVWVLDEIGKEQPITIGVQVQAGAIVNTKVLVYRESRGDEVRHGFFTDQFKNATLTEQLMLSQHIDGITGATLSVRALTKVSRLALWLHQQVQPSS